MQLAHERRQRDVDDRRVEIDHKRRQQQRDQDQGLSFHESSSGVANLRHARHVADTLAFVKQVGYDWGVLQRDYPDQVCSIARSLEVIGERWTLLILRDALVGLTRFEEFQAKLGIASNVLTNRLKRLCDEELLNAFRTRSGPAGRNTS